WARGWSAAERALGLAAFLAWPALFMSVARGAFSLLILLALTELVDGLERDRPRRAGLSLALGMLKPHLMLPIVAALAASRCWPVSRSGSPGAGGGRRCRWTRRGCAGP